MPTLSNLHERCLADGVPASRQTSVIELGTEVEICSRRRREEEKKRLSENK
jgi:hypothetical protein